MTRLECRGQPRPQDSAWSLVGFALALVASSFSGLGGSGLWRELRSGASSAYFSVSPLFYVALGAVAAACLVGLRRGRRRFAVPGLVLLAAAAAAMVVLVTGSPRPPLDRCRRRPARRIDRSMKRRLLNLLTALSLLLCVAVVALWVRSYRAVDSLIYTWGHNQYGGGSFPGGLHFGRSFYPVVRSYMRDGWFVDSHAYGPGRLGSANVTWLPEQFNWKHWGFAAEYREDSPDDTTPGAIVPRTPGRPLLSKSWDLSVPCWFLVLTTAILPMVWVTRAVRARARQTAHHCPSCGYDLRATPDRCPECGTAAGN